MMVGRGEITAVIQGVNFMGFRPHTHCDAIPGAMVGGGVVCTGVIMPVARGHTGLQYPHSPCPVWWVPFTVRVEHQGAVIHTPIILQPCV